VKPIKKIIDDYHLFIDIQMGKYLKSVRRSEFSGDAEAKLVLNKIIEAYNSKIAGDHLRLDNLNRQAKAAWFNSIEIDFKHVVSDMISEFEETFDDEFEKVTEQFYERFPFLPEGSMVVLIFVGPALEAYGLPFERFKALLLGEDECTEIEEDILLWAFDLTMSVMGSVFEYNKKTGEKFFNEALRIAQEELSREDSLMVVKKIEATIKDFEKESDREKIQKKK
jgi:hypothetical protein